MRDVIPSTQASASSGPPPSASGEFPTPRHAMAPPQFFPGFPSIPNQMPFLFPHSFMPHAPGMGFPPTPHGGAPLVIDLSEGPQKRGGQDCVTNQSKTAKKRKVVKKKPEIVELDDGNEDVDLVKNIGPWKDHWVIQLITIRGEMQNTFSAPPKQGILLSISFGMTISLKLFIPDSILLTPFILTAYCISNFFFPVKK